MRRGRRGRRPPRRACSRRAGRAGRPSWRRAPRAVPPALRRAWHGPRRRPRARPSSRPTTRQARGRAREGGRGARPGSGAGARAAYGRVARRGDHGRRVPRPGPGQTPGRARRPASTWRLEVPVDTVGRVLPVLARLGATPRPPVVDGASGTLEGEIPAASVHALRRRLTGLTRGEAALECAFAGYRPVHGPAPTRERTDHDPLDREAYPLRVGRHVAGHPPASWDE
ncbi:hypothetical protein [Streptomyces buecherae]|uniref:hypothetical protein n=1 Tax=Streptomyces buecherae TaxID=2763006 RepID=UPI0027E304D2|nr:hypothetical protein [Streptomyces buecherae]